MINPWEDENGKLIWKNQSQYFTWLRGAIRRGIWADYPLRKQWKNTQLVALTKEQKASGKFHPSTKRVGQCAQCKEWMAGSKLECDHIEGNVSITQFEHVEDFLLHCCAVTSNELQLMCKPCHKIKSHQERMGYSTFDRALADKQAIEWEKDKKVDHKAWLLDKGYPANRVNNGKNRRECYIEYLVELHGYDFGEDSI